MASNQRAQRLASIARRVDRSGGLDACWPCRTRLDKDGYGRIGRANLGIHRAVYELFVGPIPPGSCVLHRCDNPPCCNPSHLFLGTNRDNTHDMLAKRREARGERQGLAKLTEQAVRSIRREVAAGELHRVVASRYSVSRNTVTDIMRGRTWRHVSV